MLVAGEGADQHNQGALRQMEVGDQSVQYLKLVARIDKDVGVALLLVQRQALFGAQRLEGAAAGGAHRDDPLAVCLSLVDQVRRLLRQIVVLGVHLVLGDLVLLNRTEGAKANVQRHRRDVDPLCADLVQQFVGEVQPRGRCSGRTQLVGIDGLIALVVLELRGDVGRQRHVADLLEHRVDAFPLVGKADQAVAALHRLQHLAGHQPIAKGELDPRLCLFTGFDQRFPDVLLLLFQQQHLDVPAGVGFDAVQARRDNAGVVDHQQVAWIQIVDDVIKVMVAARAALAVHHQQPRVVPRLHRRLRDLLLGQIKPKF